jgi:hypothetical protein
MAKKTKSKSNEDTNIPIKPQDIKNEFNQFNAKETEQEKVLPFPVDAFPQTIQKIIMETNDCFNFPIDFIGTAILYSTSVAIGNTYRIEPLNEWSESAVLYFAIVGNPNTIKSHALSFATDPLTDWDLKYHHQYLLELKNYNALPSDEKKNEDKPTRKTILIDNATVEAAIKTLSENPRGIGVCVDELFGWIYNFNRYNNGSDLQFWLSNWSSKPIRVDRKTSDSYRIKNPFISVIGTIQTGILNEFTKNNQMKNGMIDRILFAAPDNLLKKAWSKNRINKNRKIEWYSILSELISIELKYSDGGFIQPNFLQLSPSAFEIIETWQIKNTEICNNTVDKTLAGILGKFDTYILRFSLILQLLQFACNEGDDKEINETSVIGALKLVAYFQSTAKKIYSIISEHSALSKYPEHMQKFYELLPDEFSTAEAISIGTDYKIPISTIKKWLTRKDLFRRQKRGSYYKII